MFYAIGGMLVLIIAISYFLAPRNKYAGATGPINPAEYLRFAPRASFKNTKMFYVVFGLFWIFGLLLLLKVISGGTTSFESPVSFLTSEQFAGVLLVIGTSIVMFILLIKNLAVGSFYGVSPAGLLLDMNGYKNVIAFEFIDSITEVTADQISPFLNAVETSVASPMNAPISRLSSGYEQVDLIRYLTVPIVSVDVRSGRQLMSANVKTDGSFAILKMKDGHVFLLSPKDMSGFMATVGQYIQARI